MKQSPDKVVYGSRSEVTGGGFYFACHPGVPCFTRCCRNPDMYLYPYDIIRLKTRLEMDSETFLDTHTYMAVRDNPWFPHVMLKMSQKQGRPCAFLTDQGCTVYADRPFSCRAYPLEPALSRDMEDSRPDRYFVMRHPYCKGHEQHQYQSVEQWIADQQLGAYIEHNRRWAAIDALLRANPWGPKGLENPAVKMVFMAAFNPDRFREFVLSSSFLKRFDIPGARRSAVEARDTDLMALGFDWIEFLLTGKGPLAEARTA
ncbi:MAG: YkgJ family cysteine cluster protein [Desulfosalsimonas sp.]|uniref:YkgJ family cysteine cluster protein n=1 Tax=Desulfosalsimonas sp. TaxID=3073848 RepID=UPI0039710B08